jgi:hypothetical protein
VSVLGSQKRRVLSERADTKACMYSAALISGHGSSIFFYFSNFLIIILEMKPDETFFLKILVLFNHANLSDVTYKEVTPVYLVRLKGLTRAWSPRWSEWYHVISVAPVRSARLMLKS